MRTRVLMLLGVTLLMLPATLQAEDYTYTTNGCCEIPITGSSNLVIVVEADTNLADPV